VCAFALLGAHIARAQLPTPSGPLAVGRIAYIWSDPRRQDEDAVGRSREFVVHVWYPTARTAPNVRRAEYIEHFQDVQAAVPRAALDAMFRPAPYSKLEAALPATHAVDHAASLTGSARYPLILFSHGLGNPTSIYTAEIEDLVSHGYVVAAIDHTYDTAFAALSSGAIARYARDEWSAASATPGGYVANVKRRINETWVPNIEFTLDQIIRLDGDKALGAPFAGHVDHLRIAAVGHSMGGLATVRACQLEPRILACVIQDADVEGSPFLERPAENLGQPLLYFTAATSNVFREAYTHPTDKELMDMGKTREQYDQDVARVQETQNDAMTRATRGSYRVLIDIPSFIHRTFSDLTLLEAQYDTAKAAEALANFRIAESYTLAFLDKYLKGRSGSLLDRRSSPYRGVRLDRFGSVKRRAD
jgi:alpha-beta hydrolase superfamily lysophospholipase